MLPTDKQARKERPIARGVLSYFPDAIAEVANVSYVGNKQHNGDAPMHWARGKSDDHADCIARHLIERGTIDNDGLRHSAKLAWRALANLQIEIEGDRAQVQPGDHDYHLPAPKPEAAAQKFFDRPERERDFKELIRLGCPDQVARLIVMGTTYADRPANESVPYAYVAGPMRGIPKFNFPAFDEARDLLVSQGYNVISPADIDRAGNPEADNTAKVDVTDQTLFCFRDFWALYFIRKIDQGQNSIVMLRNYERSTGATAEYGVAKWLGLKLREIGEFYGAQISEQSGTNSSRTPLSSSGNTTSK